MLMVVILQYLRYAVAVQASVLICKVEHLLRGGEERVCIRGVRRAERDGRGRERGRGLTG